ncbi:STAS domain-containing protein [Pararhodonellum marinum]|uniref:STAS domain-containing protein n=1 Tax=Pararhodonellum marinum TaxID=2755358 RepID=UPI00188DF8D8|nr:STAS domain-containing protein [Pararhodonellum marinum]
MLQIETSHEEKYALIVLKGEVDASNSVELDEAINGMVEDQNTHMLIDATDLNYISSAGLGVFMSYLEDFQEKSIRFVIFGLNDKVLHVFHILGLDQLIKLKPDKVAALQELYEA